MRKPYVPFLALWLVGSPLAAQDLNTILMESTFRIEGPSRKEAGKAAVGTVFVLGLPLKDDPARSWYVLLTANHVLDDIAGEAAVLHLRRKKDDGDFERLPWLVRIREGDSPRWIKHKEADVAAAYVALPKEVEIVLLPTGMLADDATFEKFEVHPGDELNCLGFPHGQEANAAGFPILRSGKIASYPLTPASRVKTFLYDFQVYGGNSGGPVYLSQPGVRYYGGANNVGTVQFIAGIVTQERAIVERTRTLTTESVEKHPLYLAVVAPAQFIRETVDMLPADGPKAGVAGFLEGRPVTVTPAKSTQGSAP